MYLRLVTFSQFAWMSAVLSVIAVPVYGADLVVEIEGVESAKGIVVASVFDQADSFKKRTDPIATQSQASVQGTMTFVFPDIGVDKAAVAAFHDANENGKTDTNLFGIPKEGFAFSNNPSARFGPPGYEKAMFTIDAETMQLKLVMKN